MSKTTRRPIWILLFLVPVALAALPQILWRSSREVRLPADVPPRGPVPDLQALAARAREVRPERDRAGNLLYTLDPGGAYKISLRCDVGPPAETSLNAGRALAALVAYRVARNPLEGDGYGVYLAASRVERVRYDAWRVAPRAPKLWGPGHLHPEQLGKMPMEAVCALYRQSMTEKRYRERFGGHCDLEAFSETQHMIFLDLLVDLQEPRALGPANRSRAAQMWQSVVLRPTSEIHDEVTLTFEGSGRDPGDSEIRMTAKGSLLFCLDVKTHL